MKRILSAPNLIEITQLKDVLDSAGIACFIKNEVSAGLMGEVPLTECTPELWIEDDERLPEAMQIKSDWQASAKVAGSNWVCPACGETSEPQFDSCWKCGAAKS
ncbi:MAG TPA: DUF2007 domain-containing protein [Verrucomicrobiae bacterium]|nr:DUF2007 domain-containing protein [Verrucomicrobiae bacterium]